MIGPQEYLARAAEARSAADGATLETSAKNVFDQKKNVFDQKRRTRNGEPHSPQG